MSVASVHTLSLSLHHTLSHSYPIPKIATCLSALLVRNLEMEQMCKVRLYNLILFLLNSLNERQQYQYFLHKIFLDKNSHPPKHNVCFSYKIIESLSEHAIYIFHFTKEEK